MNPTPAQDKSYIAAFQDISAQDPLDVACVVASSPLPRELRYNRVRV